MTITIIGTIKQGSSISLPLYANLVPAGFPSPAQDCIEPPISLDELLGLKCPHIYLVRAHGESMIQAGIHDKDILIVDRSLPVKEGMVVIAALNGEPLVKVFNRIDGCIVLESRNPRFPSYRVSEGDELTTWGAVTHSIRSHVR